MIQIKKIILLILICSFFELSGQEKVSVKDIYFENNLAYKIADNQIFTGQAQKIRRNGHLVFKQYLENGVLIKSVLYYNNTKTPTPANEIYYYEKTLIPKKGVSFYLGESKVDYEYYDNDGGKTLEERYENEKLIYQCKYLDGKKHGIEFCIGDNGEELRIEYKNGKKVK